MASSKQLVALFRAIYWGAARTAFRVVGPSYLLMVTVAGFVFGGQGLHPSTLTDWMLDTGWGLAAGYATWWLFCGRGYRAAAADPVVAWLRTLPLSRAAWLSALVPWALALEAPWLILWTVGTQDARLVPIVVATGAGAFAHLRGIHHRPQRRRAPSRAVWLNLALHLTLALRRRFPLAFVVLGAGWTLATALCLVMGEREVEPQQVRLEFVATTLGLAALVSAASLRWLVHDDLRRLRWLLNSAPTGVAQVASAEILAIAGQTAVALLFASSVLALRLPVLASRLFLAVVPNVGVAVLAATLVPLLTRGRDPSRAPLGAVVLVGPYLLAAPLTSAPLVHLGVFSSVAAMAAYCRVRQAAARAPERAVS